MTKLPTLAVDGRRPPPNWAVRQRDLIAQMDRAAIPFVDGHYVPPPAIYAKSILPAAVRLLDRGELRPRLRLR